MNKNNIVRIGMVLAVLAVLTAPAMAWTDDVVFYLNTSDGSHEISVAPDTEVTIYLDAYAPVNLTNGFEVSVLFDPDVVECLNVTKNESVTNWMAWGFRGVYDATPPGMKYTNFNGLDFTGQPPGTLRNGDIHFKSVGPGVTTMYLGVYPEGVPDESNRTSIGLTHHYKDWTLFEPFTFTCVAPTYTINGSTPEAVDKVTIENLNNGKKWDATVGSSSYELELTPGVDVNVSETLRIISCDVPDNYTTSCNRTDHLVENCPGVDTVNIDALDDYCQNYYPTFPFHTWNESNWSGPAAMEMLIDHYPEIEDVPNQTVLNQTAIEENNQECNRNILFADPRGMRYTLNDYLYHPYSPYVAHYGIGSSTDINDTLHYMCKWHHLGPGAAPAYGDYSNWMVVRGIHTDVEPSFTQGSYEIKGLWINDPKNPGGIGENAYKSVEQWKGVYHKMLNVNPLDTYNGTYVAVCEPPEDDDVEVTLAKPKPRLAEAITPALDEKTLMVYGVEKLALEKVVRDDEMLKIVAAAIDGVTEELIPYDAEFAEVFAKTVPGAPMLVSGDNGDYYIVPFNVPVIARPPVRVMPVKIEKIKTSGLKKLERLKRVATDVIVEPIAFEPIKVERTLVVVVVDAEDGSFKEASWVADPVKYLPVSKVGALKLALGEIDITSSNELSNLITKPAIELVYRDASPYYPDWKVTVNGEVFYVSQDGTVSS